MTQLHDIDWASKQNSRQKAKAHVWRFLLYPDFWTDPNKQIMNALHWEKIIFSDTNFNNIPTSKGIYCFVVAPPTPQLFPTNYLFYVGKTESKSLRSRYKEYINEKNGKGIGKQKPRIKIREMLNQYYGHIYFYYSEINNRNIIVDSELKLLNTFYPYVNTLIPEAQISEEFKHIY